MRRETRLHGTTLLKSKRIRLRARRETKEKKETKAKRESLVDLSSGMSLLKSRDFF